MRSLLDEPAGKNRLEVEILTQRGVIEDNLNGKKCRDPATHDENGTVHPPHAVAGESGIALARTGFGNDT